ncbi:hypothetical protein TO73_1916 [Thermus aquaticus Y51MC23]|uniref:Uncharacterized protein n=1 Tax=Thermus aquaticus (strain ATCC BAA-2747 / Y51MC23) TaxID=498848 RepID=A0ABM5VQ93_THEA5|nr:hypothetical protein TO73_1916 [Thermus aquaticus Y51MC23]
MSREKRSKQAPPTSSALEPLPQINRRRMKRRLREYCASQSLQGEV